MLPRDLIRKVRKIEIVSKRVVQDQMAGQYHSVFKSRGLAFEEVRQYIAGDDIRTIDWNVSARMRDLYVKKYIEERELIVMLLVDISASSAFGTKGEIKSDLIAFIAALIAFSAVANNDLVGLVLFTDRVERFVPPGTDRKHVLRVVSEILTCKPASAGTDFNEALSFMDSVTKQAAVCFLISDFLTSGYEASFMVTAKKHDVIPIVVRDPIEKQLPDAGFIHALDVETGDVVWIDSSNAVVRAQFAKMREEELQGRNQLFARLDMDSMEFETGREYDDYIKEVVKFFRIRASKVAGR